MPELSKLKRKRVLAGVILDDVKLATGIDAGWLSRVERGLVEASEEDKKRLANFFKCEVGDIF